MRWDVTACAVECVLLVAKIDEKESSVSPIAHSSTKHTEHSRMSQTEIEGLNKQTFESHSLKKY